VTASVEVPTPLVIYSTTWCGYCRTLKRQLVDEGIAFTEVNIEETPGAAEFVMSINRGNQTVPTVVFPDGSTLTNPRLSAVLAQLGETAQLGATDS
jgi:mycoredoxin